MPLGEALRLKWIASLYSDSRTSVLRKFNLCLRGAVGKGIPRLQLVEGVPQHNSHGRLASWTGLFCSALLPTHEQWKFLALGLPCKPVDQKHVRVGQLW